MQFDKVADRARFNVMRGRLLALRDEPEAAVKLLDWAIAVGDRRGRAEAIFARTELLLAEGQLSPAEAIDGFDRLRFIWRGDEFEFAVMRRLGELRIAEGDIRGGLITLKRAATNFPTHPRAKALTLEMRDMFRGLYTGDGADTMLPVSAIALFEEFRELVPTGKQGDAMIQRLADRLFAVDLLDKAATLLAHQVEYRLEGADKARVGARLALIHLLNGDAAHAFTALRQSEVVGVPTSLQSERRLLVARTQIELGQPADALIVLAGDSSAAADRLRAQIHWHAKEWRTAAAAYGRLAGPLPAAGEGFSDDRSRFVLSQAVALSLAGEQEQVAELRRRVGAAMEGTAYAADFRVVASNETRARSQGGAEKDCRRRRLPGVPRQLPGACGAGRPRHHRLEPFPVILTQFCCAREAAGRKASGEARCGASGEADNEADAPRGTTRRVQALLGQGGVKRLVRSYCYAPRHFPGPDPKRLCQYGSI